jgi:hypothetical protein
MRMAKLSVRCRRHKAGCKASVVYWRATERAGHGDVMPYGVLQGYSVLGLLLIAMLQPSRYTRGNDVYWVFAAYMLSKLLEFFGRGLLALGHVVSGHTLKHLAAAVAGVVICRMLMLRTLRNPARSFQTRSFVDVCKLLRLRSFSKEFAPLKDRAFPGKAKA